MLTPFARLFSPKNRVVYFVATLLHPLSFLGEESTALSTYQRCCYRLVVAGSGSCYRRVVAG
jgi:hypothetical protein